MRICPKFGVLLALILGLAVPSSFAAGAVAAPREHVVRVISDLDAFRMYFEPSRLVINPGDTVVWLNEEAIDHNVMTYPDGFPVGAKAFESPFMAEKGQRWSHTFTQEGIYDYHCLPHLIMGMHGTIIVGNPAPDAPSHVPSAAEVSAYRDKMLEYFDQEDLAEIGWPTSSRQ